MDEALVKDMLGGDPSGEGSVTTSKPANDEDDGWLRTGGGSALAASQEARARAREVRTVDDSGEQEPADEEEDEIPDMEDEEDDEEAIIRDPKGGDSTAT